MEGRRPWTHHLRLLPGGDTSVAAAVATTITLYVVFLVIGAIAAAIIRDSVGPLTDTLPGALEVFSLANAPPCFLISLWTGIRVRTTKTLAEDEAAVDIEQRRVYFGDEIGRVPLDAVTFSTRPRQVGAKMADDRAVTAFFRVNGDPDDLVALAREMRMHPGLAVEDFVHGTFERLCKDLLPDPQGIKEALGDELLRRGIVVTRVEVVA
jgi:hypothetical protein